jgi:dihydrofolate reductase
MKDSEMSKVFVNVGMSLDGYIAPEGMTMEHADHPAYKDWMGKWMQLQGWVADQEFFRKNLGLGDGGETGRDNQIVRETFERTGVSIMGKRMFDGGERFWPEEAPFHTPVFVVTNEVRTPWERPGGTTFYFVNDGIDSALEQARAVAGDRDIRISGGADVIRQYLDAGLVDELAIELAPVLLGKGTALFDGLDPNRVTLEIDEVIDSPRVTHLRYAIRRIA